MAVKKGIGFFSRLSLDAIERADRMQLEAVRRVRQDFETDIEQFNIFDTSYDEYIRKMDEATRDGSLEEFEAMIIAQLQPLIEQVINGGQRPTSQPGS